MSRMGLTFVAVLLAGLVLAPSGFTRPADERRVAGAGTVFALTFDNKLRTFASDTPGTVSAAVAVTGLGSDTLVSIDVRPATGGLYGLASSAVQGKVRLYRIDTTSFIATAVGPAFDLAGPGYAIDVDPVSDSVRLVTSSGLNRRIAFADGEVTSDASLSPGTPTVRTIAHTIDSSQATLYGIDTASDELVTIPSPGSGVVRTIGALGIDVSGAGLDLAPFSTQGLALGRVAGTDGLYTVDLATGVASLVGTLPGLSADIAIALPAPSLAFSADTASVGEDAGSVKLTVVRNTGYGKPLSVDVATADGSATAPGDYGAVTRTLTFAAGQAAATVAVPIVDTGTYETPETFTATLSNPTGGAILGSPSTTTVTIVGDEAPPTQTTTVTTSPPPVTVTTTTPGPTTTVTTPGPTTTVPGPVTTVTAPGTTPPPPDTRAPVLSLSVPSRITPAGLRAAKRLGVTLACSEACTFSGTISGSGSPRGTVAVFKGRRTGAGRVRIVVAFSAKAKAALRRTPRGTLTTRIVALDAAGNRSRASRTTVIGAPPRPDTSAATGGGSG